MVEKYFVLDIESTGISAWYGSRITAIGIRTSDGEEIVFMDKDEEELLLDFQHWFSGENGTFAFMVTKNGKGFDIPFIIARGVMNGNMLDRSYPDFVSDFLNFPHIDLHEITQKWISLDDFARILHLPVKTGNGLQAIKLWEQGKLEELKDYLKHDLWLTEQVYKRRKHLEALNKEEVKDD